MWERKTTLTLTLVSLIVLLKMPVFSALIHLDIFHRHIKCVDPQITLADSFLIEIFSTVNAHLFHHCQSNSAQYVRLQVNLSLDMTRLSAPTLHLMTSRNLLSHNVWTLKVMSFQVNMKNKCKMKRQPQFLNKLGFVPSL